uniref:Uncharacterized protein n=1 Tax=Rhizophora mucronata TaxID=61149 RepID=A0A2P2MK25_RHIMU
MSYFFDSESQNFDFQSIDETILGGLEQMEKECDIEDILSYRSAAELEMQELFSNSMSVNTRINGGNVSIEKLRNDDRALSRSRGWLNWLSRGMLGAGGTDDSGQFSGVVSDEVIKDIYEATKFHPSVASSGDTDINDKIFTCAIKCSITQHSLTLESLYGCQSSFLLFVLRFSGPADN